MAQVFISYSRALKEEVAKLAQELGGLGHQAWFDQKLAGGQVWWDEILGQIRECDFVVVALSPETLDSHAASLEWGYASELGKPLLPILFRDGVSLNLLPDALTRIQYVDYRTTDRSAAFALVNAVNQLPAAAPLPDQLPVSPEVPVSYLGKLKEKVSTSDRLDFYQQTALVQRLEIGAANGEDPDDIRKVLDRLRKREDLLASTDKRINSLIEKIEPDEKKAPSRAPVQQAPPLTQSTAQPTAPSPPPNKSASAQSKRGGMKIALIVIGVIVLLCLMSAVGNVVCSGNETPYFVY